MPAKDPQKKHTVRGKAPTGKPSMKSAEIQKAIVVNIVKELRKEVEGLENDSWMFEAPRYTDK